MTTQTEILHMTPQSLSRLRDVPASLKMAGRFLLQSRKGRLTVTLPDGRKVAFDHGEPGPRAEMEIASYDVFQKSIESGDIGFGESFMDGDWSSPDLTAVLEFFSENFDDAGGLAVGRSLARYVNRLRHAFNRNSRSGSRRNIQAHYDLGNSFYAAWLDSSMTYSAAKFSTPGMTLEEAQAAKYEAICQKLDLRPGSQVLEIGCGWGGFAEYAARKTGAHVTCLTLSREQHDYAVDRISRAGLSDLVDFRLEDYRDHVGEYDAVASIEMFEAVGEKYWRVYFEKLNAFLKSGGRAALQIITLRDDLFASYRKRADFIQRYIFPGGMLPSHSRLLEEFGKSRLALEDVANFAPDYAETLKRWSRNFNAHWNKLIEPLGFDWRFRRLWTFYLSYCEAGFQNGRINVAQYALVKK